MLTTAYLLRDTRTIERVSGPILQEGYLEDSSLVFCVTRFVEHEPKRSSSNKQCYIRIDLEKMTRSVHRKYCVNYNFKHPHVIKTDLIRSILQDVVFDASWFYFRCFFSTPCFTSIIYFNILARFITRKSVVFSNMLESLGDNVEHTNRK